VLRHKKLGSLAALLERHGGALRADLRRYYGLSLRQLFDGDVSPDEVWDCVTHLPRDSATWSAVYADPEAEIPDEPAPEPRLTEYSPEVEAIAAAHDVLVAILAHLSAFTSKKPVRLKPYRRPGEARRAAAKARIREQARAEWADVLRQFGIPE
jgi:hypothetical protein